MIRPASSDFAPFYAGYVALVPDAPLAGVLRAQPDALARLVSGADPEATYAPGKWTVRQALQHTVDTERVFALRALWFARGGGALPGFDQDAWAAVAPERPLGDLVAEACTVRAATLALLDGLSDAALDRRGEASGHAMTARAALFVVAGHTAHHLALFRDRYGLAE